jgi:hypothetical protein
MSGKEVGEVYVGNIIHRAVIEVNEAGILFYFDNYFIFVAVFRV